MAFPIGRRPPAEGAVSPAEVRILDLQAEPWPGGQRVRVLLTLTPFLDYPNLAAAILDPLGNEVASANVIETTEDQLVFTLHIRGDLHPGQHTLSVQVEYPDHGVVDQKLVTFDPRQAG